MPKRTKEQLTTEIKMLSEHVEVCIGFAFESGINFQWIGSAKRRAQELAVECQRLEDLESDGIEEAVQQLRATLAEGE
jgi:hypothetical protein